MMQTTHHNRGTITALLLAGAMGAAAQAGDPPATRPTAAQERFFESQIRPLLVKNCHECHGAEKQRGGLRLDSHAALLRGGDSGPVIKPGDPEASRLVLAIRHIDEDLQMPPKRKLADEQIAALIAWIRDGAPWPASAAPAAKQDVTDEFERARQMLWSLQPIQHPQPPQVRAADWVQTPVDQFVLSRLEAAGLEPSPQADRRTLIRRAYFDLIGLPPTYKQVEAFVHDESPDAWAKLIDDLLASPLYGQRWGRHWLDIARYADTRGYLAGGQNRNYPFSYTYRDYVIDAFNEDKPYDRFIIEQLAADKLKLGEDLRPLAAMGFLTVGRRFNGRLEDVIDDRIDVIGRGLLGLTVTCARCHDHKYDAIPTADYYSLFGVFASSVEPDELDLPRIADPKPSPEYDAYLAELAKRKAALDDYVHGLAVSFGEELRASAADYLDYIARSLPGHKVDDPPIRRERRDLRTGGLKRWYEYLTQPARAADPVFSPWVALAALPREGFADKAAELIHRISNEAKAAGDDAKVNRRVIEALEAELPKSMKDVAAVYGKLLESTYEQFNAAVEAAKESGATPPTALGDPALEQIRRTMYGKDAAANIALDEVEALKNRAERDRIRKLDAAIKQWMATADGAPPRAMVLVDADKPTEPHIFVRGNENNRGRQVPRRFLQLLEHIDGGEPFSNGSGRLEMAQAIVDPDNPLTARVMVNRIWQHHIGTALVRTIDDFGTRSDPPTHPDLLDYLAAAFIDGGWSIKNLHRLIMQSATYQQSSDDRTAARAVDAENRLLWRMNRRRLEFEPMRDAMLAASDRLDTQHGGRSVDLLKKPFSTRRAVYGRIDRQDLPGLLRVFDFASPDLSTPQRPHTTAPQQALFMLNSPFVIEQAQRLIAHPQVRSNADPAQRIESLYRLVFARQPDDVELRIGQQFVASAAKRDDKDGGLDPWVRYAQALLVSNEFVFVD